MNQIQSFFFSLAPGIASSVVVFVFRRLLGQVLSLVTGLFSRRIRGTWSTQFWKGDHDVFAEYAEVYQLFRWVWGTITYPGKGRKYAFEGTLKSDVLVATYDMKRTSSTVDRGAFTLFVNQVGPNEWGAFLDR